MANPSRKPSEPAAPKKNTKRQPNSARLAKLVIQRRTLALLLVFGVGLIGEGLQRRDRGVV